MPSPPSVDIQDLYERFGHAVYRRCQSFLRNDEDARDAMHDVFVKAAENADSFKGEASQLTWITRIATNHCLNLLRSRRAGWRQRHEQSVKATAGERLDDYSRLERAQLIHQIIDKLDAKTQAAVFYYFVDEMTQEHAAVAAQCSVPTLRKRLRTFIKIARTQLKLADPEIAFGRPPI